MKRFLMYSVLGFGAWLTFSTAWAVAARLTPLPGPARAATFSIDAASGVIGSAKIPAPLAVPRQLLTTQLRASGRAVERLYAVPERLAGQLVHYLPARMRYAGFFRRGSPCRAPLHNSVARKVEEEIQIRLDGRLPMLHTRLARLQVIRERAHPSADQKAILIRIVK